MSELTSSGSGFFFRVLNIGCGILSAWCWGTCIFASDHWAWGIFGFIFLDSTKTKRLGGILGTLDAEAVS